MKSFPSSEQTWVACRPWIAALDGQTSEIQLLDIPTASLDGLFAAVREQGDIVAVLGRDGPELFSELNWMGDDDEDLIWSTLFIVLTAGLRLQHTLAPSKPLKPGPWMSLGAGSYDLEIAFWPDELFGPEVDEGVKGERFRTILDYSRCLAGACGARVVCLTHGCGEDPRRYMQRERASWLILE